MHLRPESLLAACIDVGHNQAKSEHLQLRDHSAPLQTVHFSFVLSTDVAAAPKFGYPCPVPRWAKSSFALQTTRTEMHSRIITAPGGMRHPNC